MTYTEWHNTIRFRENGEAERFKEWLAVTSFRNRQAHAQVAIEAGDWDAVDDAFELEGKLEHLRNA